MAALPGGNAPCGLTRWVGREKLVDLKPKCVSAPGLSQQRKAPIGTWPKCPFRFQKRISTSSE